MAEIEAVSAGAGAEETHSEVPTPTRTPSRAEKMAILRKQYALPIPVRTFPLPSFYPSNPLSLVHIACAWLSQTFWPPPLEPSIIHVGVWSPATRSVNITDPRSMRTLWEQGFFGKGNYSRSEPSWIKRKEKTLEDFIAEHATLQRRAEREQSKWERSRAQQEALEQTRREEAGTTGGGESQTTSQPSRDGEAAISGALANGHASETAVLSPVGPLELLALPNSAAELSNRVTGKGLNGSAVQRPNGVKPLNGSAPPPKTPANDGTQLLPGDAMQAADASSNNTQASEIPTTNGCEDKPGPLKRRKSVRFSPRVESTTFQHTDPPSPHHSAVNLNKASGLRLPNGVVPSPTQMNGSILVGSTPRASNASKDEDTADTEVGTKEHLQLSPEESFFLTFGLGALVVLRPDSGEPFTTKELLEQFRRHSYFPPRISDTSSVLSPDDPFLVQYAVYHHFRALGWVVRGGIKFGVDWLLYKGGPVFDHADFGILVIPEYSDPWWQEHGGAATRKPWHWLHCHNRVLTRVFKHLVLAYVDVPPPSAVSDSNGVVSLLGRYHVREIMIRRWSLNRNR